MKVFRICSWALLIIGLVFKMLHWPGGSLITVVGTTLLFVHSLIFLGLNANRQLTQSLMNVTVAIWMIYLMFRVQYWSNSQSFLLIAIALTIASTFCYILIKEKPKKSVIPFYGVVVLGLLLASTRAYQVHSFMALNPILYSKGRTIDYYGWDKQTWFLYLAGDFDEALVANEKALEALDAFALSGKDYFMGPYEWVSGANTQSIILNRKNQIQQKNWTQFIDEASMSQQ
jgi:hypothetical protein